MDRATPLLGPGDAVMSFQVQINVVFPFSCISHLKKMFCSEWHRQFRARGRERLADPTL